MNCCQGYFKRQEEEPVVCVSVGEERRRKKHDDLKVCFLGESGVGKTCLVFRYIQDTFSNQESSIGASFYAKMHQISDSQYIKVNVWDTAGQERFHSLSPIYIRGSAIVFVVYDITNIVSFKGAKDWFTRSRELFDSDAVLVLLGAKSDMAEQRAVTKQDGESYAHQNGLIFMECSSKTGDNVQMAFDTAIRAAVNKSINVQ